MILWILLVGWLGNTTPLSTIRNNNEAIESFKKEDYPEAVGKLAEALKEDPENAAIHLNLGIAFELIEDNKKAMKSYNIAEKYAVNDFERFVAYFNKARIHTADGAVEAALAYYQKALEINPAHWETKVNIELLIQSQGGKGGGQDDKEDQDEKNKDQDSKKFKPNPKPTPVPFQSKKLSKKDVKKIFEELLQQEQKIRKDVDRKNPKEKARDKDW